MASVEGIHRLGRLDWLKHLPKVELHLHLEGAIPHAALWELICKYGGDPLVPSLEALSGVFHYRDFPDFIDRWLWKQGFLREEDDFELIGAAVARDLARQRIVYAEAFYSPADVARFGLTAPRVSLALRRGLASAPDVEVRLITDLVRDQGPVTAMRTLQEVADVATEAGIVGIGIGGSEQLFPPEPFAEVYERARALGLRTSAHAGEVAGPNSIWGAIRALRVDRIDHGIRAVEDPALMAYLAARRIPHVRSLACGGVCRPRANVQLRAGPDPCACAQRRRQLLAARRAALVVAGTDRHGPGLGGVTPAGGPIRAESQPRRSRCRLGRRPRRSRRGRSRSRRSPAARCR